jgi:hypothetical protein
MQGLRLWDRLSLLGRRRCGCSGVPTRFTWRREASTDGEETVETAAALKIREIEHQSNEQRRRLAHERP